jgi:hypothetical protein
MYHRNNATRILFQLKWHLFGKHRIRLIMWLEVRSWKKQGFSCTNCMWYDNCGGVDRYNTCNVCSNIDCGNRKKCFRGQLPNGENPSTYICTTYANNEKYTEEDIPYLLGDIPDDK